ncbi:hypothetical protein PR048_026649 [Dryococelus australis]|uniref:Uncharacterized protein n=1 Tax=Dryococelus australis TaxID=614101 RepID=A0ABQ9GLY0_9NEOP|nr:hypothetical protein PR048_026649 [Dryococelus australis]
MRLIDFATKRNLNIVSTFFQHKGIHKMTWCFPDKHTINPIDHFLTNARDRTMVEDVRSLRRADVGSDHFLVMVKMHQRIANSRNNMREKLDTDIKKLEQKNRFAELAETHETEVEGAWNTIKDGLLREVMEKVQEPGKNKNKKNKHWFNEEYKEITEKRKVARKK